MTNMRVFIRYLILLWISLICFVIANDIHLNTKILYAINSKLCESSLLDIHNEEQLVGVLFPEQTFVGECKVFRIDSIRQSVSSMKNILREEKDKYMNSCVIHLTVKGRVQFTQSLQSQNLFEMVKQIHNKFMGYISDITSTDVIMNKTMQLQHLKMVSDQKEFEFTIDKSHELSRISNPLHSKVSFYGNGCKHWTKDQLDIILFANQVDTDELELLHKDDNLVFSMDCSINFQLEVRAGQSVKEKDTTYTRHNVFHLFENFMLLSNNIDRVVALSTPQHMSSTANLDRAFIRVVSHGENNDITANEFGQMNELTLLQNHLHNVQSTGPIHWNLPSSQLTSMWITGFGVLSLLLLTVVRAKRNHEKYCEEKFENAARLAQIDRVRIRMTETLKKNDDINYAQSEISSNHYI